MSKLYYLQDTRAVVGNCAVWWAKDCKGYTCNLDEAHVFTEEEASDQHRCRDSDVPRPKSDVDALALRHCRIEDVMDAEVRR